MAQAWQRRLAEDVRLLQDADVCADIFVSGALGDLPRWMATAATEQAVLLTARYWSDADERYLWGRHVPPTDVVGEAIRTALINTAAAQGALVAGDRGRQRKAIWDGALRRVDQFAAMQALAPLVRVYVVTRAYEHGRMIRFYSEPLERSFVSGDEHLPWAAAVCRADLAYAVERGWVRVRWKQGRALLQLTVLGAAHWNAVRKAV